MSHALSARSIALFAVLFTAAGISYGSSRARIVPAKGEKLVFSRTYSTDFLKNHPLQQVKKTSLVLKNTKGLFTATWNATIRDIRTDEALDLAATGICKARRANHVECNFDASTGSVNLVAKSGGVLVSIPVGQGVLFSREKDGIVHSELLLGADDDNNEFRLNVK
ncbi:MAG: hypothetical protein JST04_08560 [Bdellovibrionales bacterium]|nr:hypothetical protein [Bdellovibrionales bacterium]